MKQLKSSAGVAGFVLASLVGMTSLQAMAADKVVASLGAVTVPDSDVQKMLDAMPPAERAAVKGNRPGVENWLRQRVVSEAVLREARSKGWADRPEIKARVDAAVRDVTARIVTTAYLESVAQVPADYPSEADVAAAYEQSKSSFGLPATYRLAQIYLPVTPGDAAEAKKVGEKARKLATQARAGDFAALARAESQDKTSAERGGEVGTLALADMLPEVRESVTKMKVGQVSEPVQAAAGIHIVKLLESQPARTATLDEMKPRLKQALRQQRQQQLLQEYIAKLAPADRVNIDTAALDAALQKTN
ncbi:peptidylprolyl isomerase [Herbaspirillum sp. alder98]|uniref:peptidylprolyl isomerase n=1 Tax=Herbaspirillum sp. alder98 TaxID=2913096 RepID=UPI001CD857BD|nr:peptidylprolyl isomerase [Herbaspirillum sp. alder98]MCA1325580.1 peptidylprolyl isomerase [Herbaspirillum sp. alder98]